MKLVRILILVIFSILFAHAEEVTLYTNVDDSFGEKLSPRGTLYSNKFKSYFSDFSYLKENLIDQNTPLKAERFLGFWINDFKKNMVCTSTEYNKHREYLRYVYRLLYISLMSEGLEEYSLFLRRFSNQKIDPIKPLRSCRPSSEDMKKFISRLSQFDFPKRSRLIGKLLPSERKLELDKVKQNQSPFLNHFVCKGASCNEKKVIEKLVTGVNEINKEIRRACESKLPLVKVSQQKILLSLIYDSPALNIFENDSLKSACLKKLNEKEFQNVDDGNLSSTLSKLVSFKQSNRYSDVVGSNSLGNLFNFGSLKYFDNLGLGDLIFKEVKVATIKKPIEIKQIIKVIKKKKVDKKIIKKIQKIEQKTKKKEKKYELSAIEKAILYFKVKNKSIDVDMDKFSLDYPKMKKEFIKIQKPLEQFQTRKSLNIMRRIDKLGKKTQPFPLKFLKFLIDFNFHQGLYNILAEIGDEFYVVNDVEGKKKPFKILLKNDELTNYKWNIRIIDL